MAATSTSTEMLTPAAAQQGASVDGVGDKTPVASQTKTVEGHLHTRDLNEEDNADKSEDLEGTSCNAGEAVEEVYPMHPLPPQVQEQGRNYGEQYGIPSDAWSSDEDGLSSEDDEEGATGRNPGRARISSETTATTVASSCSHQPLPPVPEEDEGTNWMELLKDLESLNSKKDEQGVTEFDHMQEFFREWLEELDLFRQGKIDSRPLDGIMQLIAEEDIGEDELTRETLIELHGTLERRQKSLEIVMRRDVQPKQKAWNCDPIIYCPPKEEWVDLDTNPAARELLSTVRWGTPQEIHDAVLRVGQSVDIGNIRDRRGRGVLHYAVQKGNVAALEYFGPLANALDAEGWAPLHYAAYFGNRICVDRLCQLGADVDMISPIDGKTAYDYAEDMQMKCTMTALALNGASGPRAQLTKEKFLETLSSSSRRKYTAWEEEMRKCNAFAPPIPDLELAPEGEPQTDTDAEESNPSAQKSATASTSSTSLYQPLP
ncbi:unnamed protein product [Amoebophrya sp. A25]|nr:unnamed protein product [Amoebophrya sp. A25]|eukprot:GSA25T00010896001.1